MHGRIHAMDVFPIRPYRHARLVFRISSASAPSCGWGASWEWIRTSRRRARVGGRWVNPGRWVHPFNPGPVTIMTIPAPPQRFLGPCHLPPLIDPTSGRYVLYLRTTSCHPGCSECQESSVLGGRHSYNQIDPTPTVARHRRLSHGRPGPSASPPVSLDTSSSKRSLCYASFGHAFIPVLGR